MFCCQNETAGLTLLKELENLPAAVRIDLDALQSKIQEIDHELQALPALLDDFERGANDDGDCKKEEEEGDRLVVEMRKWRENEALKMMKSLKESVAEMKQRAKELAATYAFDLEEDGGGGNEGVKTFLEGIHVVTWPQRLHAAQCVLTEILQNVESGNMLKSALLCFLGSTFFIMFFVFDVDLRVSFDDDRCPRFWCLEF